MVKGSEITGEEVGNHSQVTVSAEKSLAQIRDQMEKEGKRVIPVTDGSGKLEGAVGYRDLIRHMQFNPESTKIEKVIHQPPEFEKTDSLIELAELRINSGKKMLVNTSSNELNSVIGDDEFLNVMEDVEELEQISTADIASSDLITSFQDDSIEKVRHQMLDNNISRTPILNEKGELVGMLRSVDLLKAIVKRESMDAGGTSGRREGSETKISGGGEKESFSDIPVSEIMDRSVNQSEEHLESQEAIKKMKNQNAGEIVFMEDGYPSSIVTVKDFVHELAKFKQEDGILLTLVGLEVDEEKAAVSEKIRNQIRGSLGRKLENPDELKFRFRKSEKDGKKHRHEINVQLIDGNDMISLEVEDWEMLDAVDEALNELNTILRKRKGKRER